MQVQISKEALNVKLKSKTKYSYNESIVEAGLIGAKWVEIRGDKTCRCCKTIIKSGTLALTASTRNSFGDKNRTHICYVCSEGVLNRLSAIDNEIYESHSDDIDYDDGCSSNGN